MFDLTLYVWFAILFIAHTTSDPRNGSFLMSGYLFVAHTNSYYYSTKVLMKVNVKKTKVPDFFSERFFKVLRFFSEW